MDDLNARVDAAVSEASLQAESRATEFARALGDWATLNSDLMRLAHKVAEAAHIAEVPGEFESQGRETWAVKLEGAKLRRTGLEFGRDLPLRFFSRSERQAAGLRGEIFDVDEELSLADVTPTSEPDSKVEGIGGGWSMHVGRTYTHEERLAMAREMVEQALIRFLADNDLRI